MDYLLNSSMEMLDEYYQPKDTDVVISLVSTEECEQRYHSLLLSYSRKEHAKSQYPILQSRNVHGLYPGNPSDSR